MIHTASFFEPENFGPGRLVSIAIDMPEHFFHQYADRGVAENDIFQPTWNIVSSFRAGNMTMDQYKRAYYGLLQERLPCFYDLEYGRLGEKAYEALWLEDGDTLLCWEKWGQFCHRILVAELLERNGIQVVRK